MILLSITANGCFSCELLDHALKQNTCFCFSSDWKVSLSLSPAQRHPANRTCSARLRAGFLHTLEFIPIASLTEPCVRFPFTLHGKVNLLRVEIVFAVWSHLCLAQSRCIHNGAERRSLPMKERALPCMV